MNRLLVEVGRSGEDPSNTLLYEVLGFQLLIILSTLGETNNAVILEHESVQLNVFNITLKKILLKPVLSFSSKTSKVFCDICSKSAFLIPSEWMKLQAHFMFICFYILYTVLAHLIIHRYNNTAILSLVD